jgi:hypothetical protein
MSVASLTGYLATSENLTATSISTTGTIISTGSIITTDGNVVIKDPNSGATTYNTNGLTLSRNISNGQDEYDIIAVNPVTTKSLNIYTSQTSVIGGTTLPTLSLSSAGDIAADLGSITAQTGFTATTGNIVATDGDITAYAGTIIGENLVSNDDIVAENNITATAGNIVATDGDITANAGTITGKNLVSNDDIVAENNITATAGDITATAGNITATDGNITATAGNISAGGGFVATGGVLSFQNMGDQGTATYNTNHTLNFAQNLSNGQNEFDLIAINSTTAEGFRFYAGDGTTAIDNASNPALIIYIAGIRPLAIYDSTGSLGGAGQILSAGNAGGTLLWIDPA